MVNSSTDEALMLRVRDGELEKLGILYERYRTPLFSFFVRLTRSTALSEDLVHDAFLRMLKYRHTFEGESLFRTWMYQVARNVQVDSWRKRQHEVSLDSAIAESREDPPRHAPSPDLSLEQSQELNLLQRALAALSSDSREVLVLSRFQDLKYEEIAQVMGCSVSGVKMRMHRALKELKEQFMRLSREKL